MENKGTPRPWTVREFPPATVWEGGNAPYTIEASGRLIAIGCAQKGETFDNANLICRSVNAHDAMREALDRIRWMACTDRKAENSVDELWEKILDLRDVAEAALALADGGKGEA